MCQSVSEKFTMAVVQVECCQKNSQFLILSVAMVWNPCQKSAVYFTRAPTFRGHLLFHGHMVFKCYIFHNTQTLPYFNTGCARAHTHTHTHPYLCTQENDINLYLAC